MSTVFLDSLAQPISDDTPQYDGAESLRAEKTCGICLGGLHDNKYTLDCDHEFHTSCIISWFRQQRSKGRCPICRESPNSQGNEEVQHSDDDGDRTDQTIVIYPHISNIVTNPSALHRRLAPWIYNYHNIHPSLRTSINTYMRCRRFYRRAIGHSGRECTTEGELMRLKHQLIHSGNRALASVLVLHVITGMSHV